MIDLLSVLVLVKDFKIMILFMFMFGIFGFITKDCKATSKALLKMALAFTLFNLF